MTCIRIRLHGPAAERLQRLADKLGYTPAEFLTTLLESGEIRSRLIKLTEGDAKR